MRLYPRNRWDFPLGSLSSIISLIAGLAVFFWRGESVAVVITLVVGLVIALVMGIIALRRWSKGKFLKIDYNPEIKEVWVQLSYGAYDKVDYIRTSFPMDPDDKQLIDFIHNFDTGFIKLGSARHVILEKGTICCILERFLEATDLGKLKQLGKQVGNDFGTMLNRNIFDGFDLFGRKAEEKEKLILWYSCDRFCGIGKFLSPVYNDKSLSFPPVEVRFDNSFLYADNGNSHRLCEFMAGYVEGVLEKVFQNYDWTVDVNCPPRQRICVFKITSDPRRE